MAKSVNHKAKAADSSSNGPGAGPESPESLDKVRDILFGGQMRMVETRLRSIEERLLQEQAALRSDFARQVADLDAAHKRELHALNEKLASERAKRAEDQKALGAEFREGLKGLEKRHGKLEEAAALADADLRDQILQQSSALSAEMARVADRLTTALDKSVSDLSTHKLDTAALVGALTDMATRLGGNGKPSKGGGGGGGGGTRS